MKNIFVITISLVLLTAGTALAVEPQPQSEPTPEALCSSMINAKCIRCHYKTRICNALGTKSDDKWNETIALMVSRGAELTSVEQNNVVTCLSSLPEGSQVVCDQEGGQLFTSEPAAPLFNR